MSKITILGVGAMGSRMAVNLITAGHHVTIWNRSRAKAELLVEAGANVAATPRAAVAHAEFVISMVRDDIASRQLWLDASTGALAGMPMDAIAIESSTLTVGWVKELADLMQQQGIAFMDAPVAGSRPQAEAAQLIYYAGGDSAVFARAEPMLKALGSTIHHAGQIGSGAAIKLMVNALFGIQLAATAELLELMSRTGIDPRKAIDMIRSGPVLSQAAAGAAQAMLANNFTPMFPIDLVAKDFSYVVETASDSGAAVPLSEATRQVYEQAAEGGLGDDNITGIVQLYR